jgi:SpoIIAA-like
MVEPMQNMPAGTIGFRVSGDVHADDYRRVLAPALNQAAESEQGVRALFVIEDLDEIDAGALWQDTKLGFGAETRHRHAWKRAAIVTDIGWMVRSARVFAWMIPGEARVFQLAQLDDAKAWVADAAD